MFARSRPVVFDPYRRRRSSRWTPPRWLVLLLCGLVAGAAGVVFVEQRYLPPRLTAEASASLRSAFDEADAERQRLRGELADTRRKLDAAVSGARDAAAQLESSRQAAQGLRADVAALVAVLPPDPRGGEVQVRAGRFSANGRQLDYDLVLTRDRGAGRALPAVLQLVVAGESSPGRAATVAAPPVALSLDAHEIVRGRVPLPEGFTARQTTVQVLDRPAGRALGTRVLLVQ